MKKVRVIVSPVSNVVLCPPPPFNFNSENAGVVHGIGLLIKHLLTWNIGRQGFWEQLDSALEHIFVSGT